MSISQKIKLKECIGKYATTDRQIVNGAGQVIPKGSKVKIVGAAKGLSISTEPCCACGQHSYVRNIPKSALTLLEKSADYPADAFEVQEHNLELDARYLGIFTRNTIHTEIRPSNRRYNIGDIVRYKVVNLPEWALEMEKVKEDIKKIEQEEYIIYNAFRDAKGIEKGYELFFVKAKNEKGSNNGTDQ